jgi:hypothetical protein
MIRENIKTAGYFVEDTSCGPVFLKIKSPAKA